MFVLLLAACSAPDADGFGSKSGRYEPDPYGTTDSGGDTAGDSGDTGGGAAGAPVLSNLTAEWDYYPDLGNIVLVRADYTDEGDDIVGGTAYVDLYVDGEYAESVDLDVAADGDGVIATGGSLQFAFDGLDETTVVTVVFSISDSSNNISEEYSVDAIPEA